MRESVAVVVVCTAARGSQIEAMEAGTLFELTRRRYVGTQVAGAAAVGRGRVLAEKRMRLVDATAAAAAAVRRARGTACAGAGASLELEVVLGVEATPHLRYDADEHGQD